MPWPALSVYFNTPSIELFVNNISIDISHLNDLLLHVNGVGDGGPVRPSLRVLPGLAATSQGQYLL